MLLGSHKIWNPSKSKVQAKQKVNVELQWDDQQEHWIEHWKICAEYPQVSWLTRLLGGLFTSLREDRGGSLIYGLPGKHPNSSIVSPLRHIPGQGFTWERKIWSEVQGCSKLFEIESKSSPPRIYAVTEFSGESLKILTSRLLSSGWEIEKREYPEQLINQWT